MHIHELDTPAIVIDLDIMERNLRRVADYTREHELRLRPHTKTHKIPALARRQVELGAVGVTVAKVSEAEVMVESGTPGLLIAYPVIGKPKLERLASVARQTHVTVALDSAYAADELSSAMQASGVRCGVLAEMDVGLHRVGVRPGGEVLELVRRISSLPAIDFEGVAFYPGHIKETGPAAAAALAEVDTVLSEAIAIIERDGHPVQVVSGGSTPTLFQSHRLERLNEIRPGTYIFNDRNTWLEEACDLADCAASVLVTVVSTAVAGQIIVDGGSKTFSSDRSVNGVGFGYFPEARGAVLEKMNEEHGFVNIGQENRSFSLGEKLRVIPNHICVAMNLHERVYGVRGDLVEETWTVAARGKLQ